MSSIASGLPPVRPFVNVTAISANDPSRFNDAQSSATTSDDTKDKSASSNAKSAIAPTHTDHVTAPPSDASASSDFSKRSSTQDTSSRGQDQDSAADRAPREWQQPASTNAPSLRNGAPGTVLNLLA
jgi:hypothetical protein